MHDDFKSIWKKQTLCKLKKCVASTRHIYKLNMFLAIKKTIKFFSVGLLLTDNIIMKICQHSTKHKTEIMFTFLNGCLSASQ